MWQLFVLSLIFTFLWIRNRKNFFVENYIPNHKSFPLIGIFWKVAIGRQSVYDNITELYNDPNLKDEPFYGFYLFHQPALLIKNLELIKRILVTDFDKFPVRFAGSDCHDPLGDNFLFFTKDVEKRKIIRSQLSPFFSGTKQKFCFDHIQSETVKFLSDFKTKRLKFEVDISSTFESLIVNIIGNVAFGVDASRDENFHKAIKSIFEPSLRRHIEFGAFIGFRKVMKYLRLNLFGKFATEFFMKIIPEVIEERIKSGGSRNDFIDMIIKVRKQIDIEEKFIDTQVMMFIGGAYAPCLIAINFTLFELSRHQSIQSRLRSEIQTTLKLNEGHLTYETISTASSMPFLHQIVCEILRLYPVLTILDRQCMFDGYSLEPFSNFKIPHGMPVWIPIFAIARDEKYFPQPLKFDPSRFENAENLPPCKFLLSFGCGPKRCIAERFSMILIKSVIVNVLKEFRVEGNERTPKEIKFRKDAYIIESEEKIFVDFVRDPIKF